MNDYPRYQEFTPGTKCAVSECKNEAEFEVILYDFYEKLDYIFYEQDYTCPLICQYHLEENERLAVGDREPRQVVTYPYTNKHEAQGHSRYVPLTSIYPNFFEAGDVVDSVNLRVEINEISDELISYIGKHPGFIRNLDPRKFEELVASILEAQGYEVTLTPKSRDGGKDIVAVYKGSFGHLMFVYECKHYDNKNKVGVGAVRGLYGVKMAGQYNQAVLVTTSSFTKPATDFVKPLKFELLLKDHNDVIGWCKTHGKRQIQ